MTFQSLKENNHPQIWIQEMKIVDYLIIGATIYIGPEILCLPYAGFCMETFHLKSCMKSQEIRCFFVFFLQKSVFVALSNTESSLCHEQPSVTEKSKTNVYFRQKNISVALSNTQRSFCHRNKCLSQK